MQEIVSKRQLRACGDRCCFIDLHCVNFYAVLLLTHLELYISVPDWRRTYQSLRLLFVPTPVVLAYYLNLNKSHRASELIFCIAVSEFCVYAILFSLLGVPVWGTVRFSSALTCVDDIAAHG